MAFSSLSLSLFSSIFAAVAFFLSWSSAFNCSYVNFSSIQDTDLNIGFGLWSHNWYAISLPLDNSFIFQTCITYGSTPIDAPMKAARVFAIIALVLGGVFFFASLFSVSCFGGRSDEKLTLTRSEGVAYLLVCLCQGLSLLLLNSTICTNNSLIADLQSTLNDREKIHIDFIENCSISKGARCCIAAIVFWFMAALTSCLAVSAERKKEVNKEYLREPLVPSDIL
jgi:hypothetical protein